VDKVGVLRAVMPPRRIPSAEPMTSHYKIWTVAGKAPQWGTIDVRNVAQLAPDCWKVSVPGTGADLVKFVKSRRDLFFCYLRVSD
jgi:hypothetical protein